VAATYGTHARFVPLCRGGRMREVRKVRKSGRRMNMC
jgi:hypothetical protein